MPDLETVLWGAMLVCLLLGGVSVLVLRGAGRRRKPYWARALFVVVLLVLGAGSVVAALRCPPSLMPLGLAAGGLVTALLWEGPGTAWQEDSPTGNERR
jgi:4-amino-4-deoxy-L-arabinose transferase-like glycosyltransferase